MGWREPTGPGARSMRCTGGGRLYLSPRNRDERVQIERVRERGGLCCWDCGRWTNVRRDGVSFQHVPLVRD